MKIANNDIRKTEDLEDGSSVYEIGPREPEKVNSSFTDNLADGILSEETLRRISTFLIEKIAEDIEASKPWFDAISRVKKVLGFDIEDTEHKPFPNAVQTYDTTLATSLIRFYATARAELLPASGPAGYRINGEPTEELEAKGDNVRDWLNYYLTVVDKSYYADFERFLMHLGLNGTGFKKIYHDQILKRPIVRFIMSDDFVIDGDCTSILDSNRLTHILHLSKREILLQQQNGTYRDVELSCFKSTESADNLLPQQKLFDNEGSDNKTYTEPSLFSIYESHVYLNLEDFGESDNNDSESIPLPYIVLMEPISREILSIRRNWEEEDINKNRINYFVQYNYLPGFGIRGLGLAHLLGSNAITLTKILRELVDAGQFKNLPAGFKSKGVKQQNNDLRVGPGEWVEVNTGGTPLQEAFMPLPYGEPCQTLRELRMEVVGQTKELGSTSELGMMESREDISTGTAMAFLETNNRIQSAVLKSIHYSLTQELQLLDKLFRKSLDMNFSENVNGKEITVEDFADEIQVVPISDPSINSTIQKIIKADSCLQVALQDPQIHVMREVFKLRYRAQGMDDKDIDKILKPDPAMGEEEVLPLDPVSENVSMMRGQPVKVAIWQEHAAHNYVHGMFAQQTQDPAVQAEIVAHMKEHDAQNYLLQMQQLLGQELPPLAELQNPEVQNSIALAIAQGLEETGVGAQPQEAAPIDPNALLMADIQQKEAETVAREKIANLKAETDIFKAQLDFEKEKAKIESAEDIAALKAEVELTKQGVINE